MSHAKHKMPNTINMPHQPFAPASIPPRRRHVQLLLPLILSLLSKLSMPAQSNSINYGIHHQPITDVALLMPTLCQNQSVICEGSFCIPGVRKCVCDLRLPVQLGRFCLRQIDIETKCFSTKQCNHTIKDAVCMDSSSSSVLDADTSKFKLEQWQQLSELRQASQPVVASQDGAKQRQTEQSSTTPPAKAMFLTASMQEDNTGDNVIMSSFRNSPYEINYYTPELLQQNHTRRKGDSIDRNINSLTQTSNNRVTLDTQSDGLPRAELKERPAEYTNNRFKQSIVSVDAQQQTPNTDRGADKVPKQKVTSTEASADSPPTTSSAVGERAGVTSTASSLSNELSKKKMVVKALTWPPGVCSCPPGYMFDSMLRKCLALSLNESHCLNDNDCRQIRLSHCSRETKKCECDEPLVWNSTDLACVRPKPKAAIIPEKAAPPLFLSELLPDQTMILLIFVIAIIVATLLILWFAVKCCSSNKSALISPTSQKHKKSNQNSLPRSPYATLRKTEKQSAQINSFTQQTRGRILNYDFEQDNPIPDSASPRPPSALEQHKEQQQSHSHGTLERGGTLAKLKGIKQGLRLNNSDNAAHQSKKGSDVGADESLDLNELDSETKSEQSILAPPPPQPTNQPTYMLAGQQSAIAAAAAAVANRRNFGKPEFV